MKKLFTWAVLAMTIAMYSSCSKEKDLYVPTATNQDNTQAIADNVKNIFGVTFDAEHDWTMLQQHKVSITADAELNDIAKVAILTSVPSDKGNAYVLNSSKVKAGETITLIYDVPEGVTRLIALCLNNDGAYRIKGFNVGQESVSFGTKSNARGSRRAFENADFPTLPIITAIKTSYNADYAMSNDEHYALWKNSGWENDRLYRQKDEATVNQQIITVSDMTEDERMDLQDIIASYLPSVVRLSGGKRLHDNWTETILPSGGLFAYDYNYLTTVGDAPVRIAPIYQSGDVSYLTMFYYYFKPEDIPADMSEVEYIKRLPKFELAQRPHATAERGKVVRKDLFTLAYYGHVTIDQKPAVGTQAESFIFPEGYKIGFFMRNFRSEKKDGFETGHGDVYGDGRLNYEVNRFGRFYSARLDTTATGARAVTFGANGKGYYCVEDGTDQDFDDIIFEIESGVQIPETFAMDLRSKVYTFAFEDRDLGDYDMNDVVVKAQRIDETTVKWSLEAVGAHDELYLRNINGKVLNGNTEVHALFNMEPGNFINTEKDKHIDPVQETVTVDKFFSFSKPDNQVYIYNKTTGKEIRVAAKGEDPHAILIPHDWQYPLEQICVGGTENKSKVAYRLFNNWGVNKVTDTDWYVYPEEGMVYTLSVFK